VNAFGPATAIPALLLIEAYWLFGPKDRSWETTRVNEMR
jgi:hypothetical protein